MQKKNNILLLNLNLKLKKLIHLNKIKNKFHFKILIQFYYLKYIKNILNNINQKKKVKDLKKIKFIQLYKFLKLKFNKQYKSQQKFNKYIQFLQTKRKKKTFFFQQNLKSEYKIFKKLTSTIKPLVTSSIKSTNIKLLGNIPTIKNLINWNHLKLQINLKEPINPFIKTSTNIILITRILKKNFFITIIKNSNKKMISCNKGPFPRDLRRNIQSSKLVIKKSFQFLKNNYKKIKFNKKLDIQIKSRRKIKKKLFLYFLKIAKRFQFKIQRISIFPLKAHGGCRLSKKKRK